MAGTPAPFSRFEWLIAWRYIRAKRAEGGVSVMTWISLIGITLAVWALVATLAIRTGLREEFLDTILGANAHLEILYIDQRTETGGIERGIPDYEALTDRLRQVDGVVTAAPVVRGQVMGTAQGRNTAVDVFGITLDDLMTFPSVAQSEEALGDISRLNEGIALGRSLAADLGVTIGDRIQLISPNGVRTAFGTSPRVNAYEVVYIFTAGQYFVDRSRAYLPLDQAQSYFNKDGVVDQIDITVTEPEGIVDQTTDFLQIAGPRSYAWSWQDRSRDSIRALAMQDNALFILLGILILIASMNIVSGLIMLVKNKGRDIGILRTMGLTEGSILRVFFLCGASIGTMGTLFGVTLGVLFSLNIDGIYTIMDYVTGADMRQMEIRGFTFPPAILRVPDVLAAMGLSLALSWIITIFPARRAARMNPVEALRYE